MSRRRALVAGAGGFIGGHLVQYLLKQGYDVRCVDIKPLSKWYQVPNPGENFAIGQGRKWDLRNLEACVRAVSGVTEVYNLAADMGGMGFIETHKLDCMLSVLINTHLLWASARTEEVEKYFYASSACVYPGYRQNVDWNAPLHPQDYSPDLALKEEHAYPADPEDGYGWEKLFSERMCRHFHEDRGLDVRIARYHNVYGPHGTWTGGREKAPAAICRKYAEVAQNLEHNVEIWGNGEQLRSFMYIDDCIEGTRRLMESNYTEPINIGSNELVSINQLADEVEAIARWHKLSGISMPRDIARVYDLTAPQGVQGRNSDNTLIKKVLNWEPKTRLHDGLEKTYKWVYDQVSANQLVP